MLHGFKECRKCGELKHRSEFPPDKRATDKVGSRCRDCYKKYRDQPMMKNRKKKYDEEYRSKPDVKLQRRIYELWYGYSMTLEDYNNLLKKQKGVCKICGRRPYGKDNRGRPLKVLCVDHKGKTIRGLLCLKCNAGLGHFMDSPMLLREAANYLEKTDAECEPTT